MQKNILFITNNFIPLNSIGTQRIIRICKYLNNKWYIHLLTLKKKYYPIKSNNLKENNIREKMCVWRTSKFDLHSSLIKIKDSIYDSNVSGKINSRIICGKKNQNIKNTTIKKTVCLFIKKKAGFLTEIFEFPDKEIAWVPFATMRGYYIIKKKKIDVIFSSSPKHSNHLTAMILKVLTKKKWIAEFRDPWARSPWHNEERNTTSIERLKHKIIKVLECLVVQKADRIILVTRAMKDEFSQFYSYLPNEKFKVVYNGYDPANQSLLFNNHHTKSTYKNKNLIIFSHIGALYKKRDPTNLVKALYLLREEKKLDRQNILLQFIGNIADDLLFMKKLIDELNLQNWVKFIPQVSFEKSFQYMNNSDVLIILQPLTTLQLPGKFYDYICFDKTIFAIGEPESEVEKVIDTRFGLFADNNNINEIKNGLLYLSENPKYCVDKVKNNKKVFCITESVKMLEEFFEK